MKPPEGNSGQKGGGSSAVSSVIHATILVVLAGLAGASHALWPGAGTVIELLVMAIAYVLDAVRQARK